MTDPRASLPAAVAAPVGARGSHGVLLLRAPQGRVESWARTGLVAAQVVPLGGWTALLPLPLHHGAAGAAGAGAAGAAGAAAEKELELFAGRPLPGRLRPAVGMFVFGSRAVVTVHRSGRHAIPLWLVWQPGEALVDADPLPPAELVDLAAAAQLPSGTSTARIRRVLEEPSGTAGDVLAELLDVLALPGRELLAPNARPVSDDQGPGGARRPGSGAPAPEPEVVLVQPSEAQRRRFVAIAREDARHRSELES